MEEKENSARFSRAEKVAYFRRKWLREHAGGLVLAGCGLLGLAAAGVVLRAPLLIGAAALLTLLAHGWRHNAMMTYVEKMAFDGSGQ
ncbi:MAG: hypothetical protein ACSW8F_06985 [bacterium]